MRLDDWFDHARRDAARRGLPALEPLLDMLLDATRALRAADWAQDVAATGEPEDTGARRDGAPPPGPTLPARDESE